MAKQTFTAGQVLTAAEMNSLQENDYNWTVTTKTASYTLAAGDEGTRIVMNNAGATTITVDDAIFSAGDVVWLHNIGAGTCTVTAGTATVSTVGDLALEQYAGGHLYFTSASAAIFFPTEQGGGGKILQVVSAAKTDTFSTTSTSAVDVTGLSAAITPSSASNKVLVTVSFPTGMSVTGFLYFVLDRNGTDIFVSSDSITAWSHPQTTSETNYVTFTYLDSPASTSAQTYKLQMYVSAGTGYIGRRGSSATPSIPSSITVMEVSA